MSNTFIITASIPTSHRAGVIRRTGEIDRRTGKPLGTSGYIQRLVAADLKKLENQTKKGNN